jgi:outer membrane protein
MRTRLLLLTLLLPLTATAGPPGVDMLVDFLSVPGSAGLGLLQRFAASPYRGAGLSQDLVPLYMYEGELFYLHATRVGVKLSERPGHELRMFLDYRFEGYPVESRPVALAGMALRVPGVDFGVAYRYRKPWGNFDVEILHDANNNSNGTELRFAFSVDLQSGRWHLRPLITVGRRNGNLNNYYYGVRSDEARPDRPFYVAGDGYDLGIGVVGYYDLSQRWRLLGGVGANWVTASVVDSPIVDQRLIPSALIGASYDFGSHKAYADPGLPLHVKMYGGIASECNFLPALTLRCSSTNTPGRTRIWGVDVGRALVEQVHGWPLDFVGYVGVGLHDERGRQPDGEQITAQIKAYWFGFPWNAKLRTRLGFGAGFSYARRVPFIEVEDQARRGRATSRLLNYLDPSIDVSVGDVFGNPRLKESYIGLGISHRSGIFGASQIFGNINGGSNYFYTYLEVKM